MNNKIKEARNIFDTYTTRLAEADRCRRAAAAAGIDVDLLASLVCAKIEIIKVGVYRYIFKDTSSIMVEECNVTDRRSTGGYKYIQ